HIATHVAHPEKPHTPPGECPCLSSSMRSMLSFENSCHTFSYSPEFLLDDGTDLTTLGSIIGESTGELGYDWNAVRALPACCDDSAGRGRGDRAGPPTTTSSDGRLLKLNRVPANPPPECRLDLLGGEMVFDAKSWLRRVSISAVGMISPPSSLRSRGEMLSW